jgi:hypothetical protein
MLDRCRWHSCLLVQTQPVNVPVAGRLATIALAILDRGETSSSASFLGFNKDARVKRLMCIRLVTCKFGSIIENEFCLG